MKDEPKLYEQKEQIEENQQKFSIKGYYTQHPEILLIHHISCLVFSILVLILALVSDTKPFKGEWNAIQFLYITFGFFFVEATLALFQIILMKSKYGESLTITFLRIINFIAFNGYFIYSNICFYTNNEGDDYTGPMQMAFIVLILTYVLFCPIICIYLFYIILYPII